MTGYEQWSRAGWAAHLPGVTDIPAHVAGLGEATIPGLAAASADRVPDRVALEIDGEQITHAALNAGAAQVAAWLATRLAPGDRVLLAARSSLGFVRCYLGALRAGAVVVLANPAYTPAELAHLVTDSGAALAFADPGPARLLAGLPNAPLTADPAEVPAGPPGRAAIVPGPDDTALLAYTSGTTGKPKAVPLTHRGLLTSIRVAMASWGWREDDVLAHALPLFHQHGLSGVHAVLIAGGTAHIAARFTAAGLASAVRQHHATVLFAVPTMYQALLDDGQRFSSPGPAAPRSASPGPAAPRSASPGPAAPRSASPGPAAPPYGRLLAGLRLAVCGSAPLTALLAERSATQLGRAPLVRYGLTETGLNVSHVATDIRPGSVGIPFPGVLVRLWAESAPAPPGADGEIQVRGPHVFHGYAGNPSATADAFTADGWFRTGDIGRLDRATGHLEIRGRIKEMIISGGLNVYPREVETVLEEHPAVAEAAVAGLPHPHWGEQVTAWVTLRPGHDFDEAALIAHARTALAGYKTPKRIYLLPALPRTPLGKLRRTALTPPD
jgi:acyl-CoA synthetase (AMP-forming)/AMP-acid ligase II